jgi:flagellar export protein FliJ
LILNKYLTIEQRRLDEIGAEKVRQQSKKDIESDRLKNLEAVRDAMKQPLKASSLLLQNRYEIRDQLGTMVESQKQEVALANADIVLEQQKLIRQFGRVKAFQIIQKKKSEKMSAREKRIEQVQNDDWTSQSLRRA